MKKTLVVILLSLTLLTTIIGAPVFAESTYSVDLEKSPFTKNLGYEKSQKQLTELFELGLLREDPKTKTIDKTKPDIFKNYKRIRILNEGSRLIGLNTSTNEIITDIDSFISEYKESKDYNHKSKTVTIAGHESFIWFTVKFFLAVGNPDTWSADLIHTATVTDCSGFGSCPNNYTAILTLNKDIIRYGSFDTEGASDIISVEEDEDAVLIYDIATTDYWIYDSVVYANTTDHSWPADSESSEPVLLNKKGKEYPLDYEDPQSGIQLYDPQTNLVYNPQERSNTYRSEFINYYENNWGKPNYFTWDQVDIHHMRPLSFGGSNSMYNLIPLMNNSNSSNAILSHSYLTSWWNAY